MLEKIKAGWNVLQQGQVVADPSKWKKHQINANMIAAVVMALVYAAKVYFNVDIPIDQDAAVSLGGGILVVVNVLLTYATTDKIGLPSKRVAPAPAEDEYARPDELRNDRINYDGGS